MANSTSHGVIPYPVRKARYSILVSYLDADGDPTDPTTPDTEVSKDAGAFADCAEEVTTISGSNGMGYITLSGAEMDCALLALAAKVASGPKATLATLYPRDLPILESGTASAGGATSITLASGTYTGLDLTGLIIRTTGGTGGGGTGGANNQARVITAYNTSTRVATVNTWETNPSSDTTYDILLPTGVPIPALTAVRPTTLARTLDVSSGGEAGVDWANVGTPGSTVDLSATTTNVVNTASALTTNNDKTGYALSSAGVQAIWDAFTSALTTVGSIGKLLVDNVNATISSRLASASYTAPLDAAGTRAAVGLAAANLDTQLGAIDDYIDTEVAAIKAKTDNLPAAPAATGDIPTANANADALLDRASAVEGFTVRELMRLFAAALVGKSDGLDTATAHYRDVADTKDRITATVDADGNRSAVTLDAS